MKPVRHLEQTTLLVCFLLAIFTFGRAPPTLAQDGSEVRGANGPIDKERLLEALASRTRGGPMVAGHVIKGEDVIAILRASDVPIELEDCVIEGGLVFRDITAVTVPITIENCELRAAPLTRALWAGTSIYAKGTRFDEQVTVRRSTLAGPANFNGAEFRKKAIFPGSMFPEGASFVRTQFAEAAHFSQAHFNSVQFDIASFEGQANFRRAKFDNTAYFDRATFADLADFHQAVFRAEQYFAATFRGPVRFDQVQFEEAAVFSESLRTPPTANANFEDSVSFNGTRFGGRAAFSGQFFPADTQFADAEFSGLAEFARARFQQRALFGNTKFVDGADFAGATFEQLASFQSAEFLGESDFSDTRFGDEAGFVNARFGGLVFFVSMQVERFARFRSATFDGEVDFDGAAFGESADFQGTSFKDLLTLTGTDFGAYADFRDAEIAMLDLNSVHNPTILRSRFDMRGARIGEAHFQDVIFEADVDFSDASFGLSLPSEETDAAEDPAPGTTILRFATFEDDVSFARARFAGRLAVENVKFQRTADFTDADFSAIARGNSPSFAFSYVDFGDLRLRWPQLPEPRYWVQSEEDAIRGAIKTTSPVGRPEPISRTLSELEVSFKAGGRLDDANAAYFQRKLAELGEARSGGWDTSRLLFESEWLFWGLVCGYGTKIWWALGWALLANLIFTLIYWSSATVTRQPHPDTKEEFSFRLRLLDLPKQYSAERADLPVKSGPLRKLIDSLRVSTVILFKLGYRDTTLAGRFGPLPIAYVVAVEWGLGFYLLAALTVTLANTQPLINRLIAGVF